MRLVAPSRSRNSSGVSHARRRTISSSIMAMCAAGPPNDVAPRRRNNSASSESVVRRPLSVIPRSNASESTDDGRRTTENFYQLDLPRVVHVVRGEAEHVLRAAIARFPAERLGARGWRSRWTNAQHVYGLASHDVYHAGQIQLIKVLRRPSSVIR